MTSELLALCWPHLHHMNTSRLGPPYSSLCYIKFNFVICLYLLSIWRSFGHKKEETKFNNPPRDLLLMCCKIYLANWNIFSNSPHDLLMCCKILYPANWNISVTPLMTYSCAARSTVQTETYSMTRQLTLYSLGTNGGVKQPTWSKYSARFLLLSKHKIHHRF
jgi:hypothetical protein